MLDKSATKTKILFLDGLRGIAALYVLIGHARWLLWEGYENGYLKHKEAYSLFDKVLMYFLSIFRFGHEFVLFFFVLSGFVIHIGYAKKLQNDGNSNFKVGEYLYKRSRRIYPPFILALLLTALLDFIGQKCSFTIYTGQTPYALINKNLANKDHSIATFLGNIPFLYKEYFPVFGTNGPVWSLKYEWWFYLVYPFFLLISTKNIYYSSTLIVILFVGSFYPYIWPEELLRNVFSMMLSWWLGVILSEIVVGRLKINLLIFSVFSLFMFILFFFMNTSNITGDLQVAFLFTSVLGVLLWYNGRGKSLRLLENLKPLGDFSYTLYITHFPVLVLFSGWVMFTHQNSLPHQSFFVIAGIFICCLLAYLFHFIVEVPFLKSNKAASVPVRPH